MLLLPGFLQHYGFFSITVEEWRLPQTLNFRLATPRLVVPPDHQSKIKGLATLAGNDSDSVSDVTTTGSIPVL